MPHANVVSIDCDPDASEIDPLNRIELMVGIAHKNTGRVVVPHEAEDTTVPVPA